MCHFYPFSYLPCFPVTTSLQGTKLLDGKMKDNKASIHSLKKKITNDGTSFPDSVKWHISADFIWPTVCIWTRHNAPHCTSEFWNDQFIYTVTMPWAHRNRTNREAALVLRAEEGWEWQEDKQQEASLRSTPWCLKAGQKQEQIFQPLFKQQQSPIAEFHVG